MNNRQSKSIEKLQKENYLLKGINSDLLKSCKLMIDFFPEGWEVPVGWNIVVSQVRQAISKAEGEQ